MKNLAIHTLAITLFALTAAASSETICRHEHCYSKEFEPTDEFKEILEGQEVPSGLHYRINLETGRREAKKVDPSDSTSYDTVQVEAGHKEDINYRGGDIVVVPDEPVVPPPPSLKPNHHLTPDVWFDFKTSLSKIHESTNVTNALNSLEEASHEVEFGLKIINTKTLERLLFFITDKSQDHQVRALSAIIIGNSLQNNPHACATAGEITKSDGTKLNLLATLLNVMSSDETSTKLKGNVMYAVARAVRVPGGQRYIVTQNGLEILRNIYKKHSDPKLRRKVAAFVKDEFLDQDMIDDRLREEASLESAFKINRHLGLDEVAQTNLKAEMAQWCTEFKSHLEQVKHDEDMKKEMEKTINMIQSRYPGICAWSTV